MKRIGIVGGLGPESTIDYYKEIISAFNTTHAELAYPEIIVYSVNLNAFLKLAEAKDWAGVSALLSGAIDALHRAGAEFAAIASNSPHMVFGEVSAASPIPLVSIVEATCDHARSLGLEKLGLLGTKFSMQADFYKAPFNAAGISIVVPSAAEQELIHHRLFAEIELGVFKDSTRDELLAIAGRMVDEDGIDGLVLGCTELPLILTAAAFGIPFLNTTAIHCERIVSRCLQD